MGIANYIINKVLPVQLTGSNLKKSINFAAASTDNPIPLAFLTRELTIVNDGADNLSFAFDGKSSTGITSSYQYTDPAWTTVGAWSTGTFSGYAATYTGNNNTSNNVVFKTTKSDVQNITFGMIKGQASGIAKVEFSTDNGATWKNPSDILGVSRSDGVTGTALNTVDQYVNVASQYGSVTYTMPYNTSGWSMRITPTNTKNASATGTPPNIFVVEAKVTDGNGDIFTIKPKENLSVEIQTNQINVSSPTETTGRVFAI